MLEGVHSGRLEIRNNCITKCSSIGFKFSNCRTSKDSIVFDRNVMTNVYNCAVSIESSTIALSNCDILASAVGVNMFLMPPTFSNRENELYDSHRDIIVKDNVGSFIMGGSNHTHMMYNLSLLNVGTGVTAQPGTSNDLAILSNCSKVTLKNVTFKEISQCGIYLQGCLSSTIKIEACIFTNVKDPILMSEKELPQTKLNTRNMLPEGGSEMQPPSIGGATPRTVNNGKGTVILKHNRFEGCEVGLVKKHVASYLYEIGNIFVPALQN